MFNGINLSRTSTKPADTQPLPPKGSDKAGGSSSTLAHPQLSGRNSPGAGPSTMAPRGSPLLKRSDALSPQAQANAQAAFPGRRVQFAADASIVQDGVKVGREPVEFGAKKPSAYVSAHHPSPSVAASPPEPPPPAPRQEPKRGLFANMFSSSHAGASSSAPPQTAAQASPADAPHVGTSRTPAEKFSGRLSSFMEHCPEGTLKRTLRSHLAQGNFQGFKNAVMKALTEHQAPNQAAYEALALMNSALKKMSGFAGVPLQEYVASSPLQPAAAATRTPAEKFSERLTKFMGECPEGPLRRALQSHVLEGNLEAFKAEVRNTLAQHAAPEGTHDALMAMNSALRNMSDFSGVRINYARTGN